MLFRRVALRFCIEGGFEILHRAELYSLHLLGRYHPRVDIFFKGGNSYPHISISWEPLSPVAVRSQQHT